MDSDDKIADSVQEKFIVIMNNLVSMPVPAAARLLAPNNALVRACTHAAAPRPGSLLR
jgi:hypothetical protein